MRRALASFAVVCCAVSLAAACSSQSSLADAAPVADAGYEDSARRRPVDDSAEELPPSGPRLLSETGLYSDFATRTVSPELLAFVPRYEFWADGALKGRWLYLPPGTKIDTSRIDHWTFPVGTKAFKEFRTNGKLVETRLLMKVREGTGNGAWWQVAYVWMPDGTDAVATPLGEKSVLGTTHDVPTQIDCGNCHGGVSDVLLGVSALQLTDPTTKPLTALSAAGRLSSPPAGDLEVPGTGLVKEALGYLHANCGNCHNDESIRLNTQTKMRLRLLVDQKTPEETGAYSTTVGVTMKHVLDGGVTDIVVKGDPDRSGLFLRMGAKDLYRMPPAGTNTIDDVGRESIRQWISSWQ